jgi:hypothetical protein
MRKIAINYLHYRRDGIFHDLTFRNLIRASRLDLVKVNFLVNNEPEAWMPWADMLRARGAQVEVVHFANKTARNYTEKIEWAVNQPEPYSVKLDEDVFVPGHVWDFMFQNIECLDDPENLTLVPLLSNGIPAVDMFVEDFFTEEEKYHIHALFAQFKNPVRWQFDYGSLDTPPGQKWDWEEYARKVRAFDTPIKGIHPVRMHPPAHYYLNQKIVDHADQFDGCKDLRLEPRSVPYFCNSFFCIATHNWKRIFDDQEVRRVGKDVLGEWAEIFDEIPINFFMREHDMKVVFVRNGFAVHTMYNTLYGIDGNSRHMEREFVAALHGAVLDG